MKRGAAAPPVQPQGMAPELARNIVSAYGELSQDEVLQKAELLLGRLLARFPDRERDILLDGLLHVPPSFLLPLEEGHEDATLGIILDLAVGRAHEAAARAPGGCGARPGGCGARCGGMRGPSRRLRRAAAADARAVQEATARAQEATARAQEAAARAAAEERAAQAEEGHAGVQGRP